MGQSCFYGTLTIGSLLFFPSHSLFLYHRREAAGWVAQFRDHMEVHKNGTPQLTSDFLRQMFSIPEYTFSFQPHEEREWAYHVPTTDQCVIDRILSWSYITVVPPEEKAKLVEDIKGILERGDDKVWISKEEGTCRHPYKACVEFMSMTRNQERRANVNVPPSNKEST
jgi:hypothetical protein